jgi:fatty-acyl-CoA synthase
VTVGLLDWLEAPDPRRGLSVADEDGGWQVVTYDALADGVRATAARLMDAGLARGDVVALVAPTGPLFVHAFFGTLLAGGTPSPLVPPTIFQNSSDYARHTAPLIRAAAAFVLTDDHFREPVERAAAGARLKRPPLTIPAGGAPVDASRAAPADLALLQFTSGSTGSPRGVEVSWESLELNMAMILGQLAWTADEGGVSWLPLYHDMGLVGCLLTPVVNGRHIHIMRPDQFVRDPLRWLEPLGTGEAVHTANPNFGLSYTAKRLGADALADLDFSSWRTIVVGAERLDPGAFDRFARLLGSRGFEPATMMPAYGLAEATLAVTMVAGDRAPRLVRPDWPRMAFGEAVPVAGEQILGTDTSLERSGWLVGCGAPLPGLEVWIGDGSGGRLPEGHFGEVHVAGPTVAAGYRGSRPGSSSGLRDSELRTGDAGFLLDGELFVIGRIGDALKVRGRMLYAEDLESKLGDVPGVPTGQCIVVPGAPGGRDGVVAVVEAQPGEWVDRALGVLEREVNRSAHVQILVGPRGTIRRTSSGKPRRRSVWRDVIEGRISLEVAAESDSAWQDARPSVPAQ